LEVEGKVLPPNGPYPRIESYTHHDSTVYHSNQKVARLKVIECFLVRAVEEKMKRVGVGGGF
jgi:hypothetical protein